MFCGRQCDLLYKIIRIKKVKRDEKIRKKNGTL